MSKLTYAALDKVELERGDGSRNLEFMRSRVEALQKLVDAFAGK